MTNEPAALRAWTVGPLCPDVTTAIERMRRAEDVRHVAIMPDVHLGKDVCVGAVVATQELIYPAAIGGDIGCGMLTAATDAAVDLLGSARAAATLLSRLSAQVPGNRQKSRLDLPPSLQERPLSEPRLEKLAQRDGRVQLGTLGSGNHFLEFQTDAENRLWLMIHSGSRAMGQAISRHHRERRSGESAGLGFLEAASDAGRACLQDMEWARQYAAENRLAMLRSVEAILQADFATAIDWTSMIHGDHDHIRRETHHGAEFWIHRKGAQSAAAGEAGVIPGSMGTASYHVVGRGCPEALCSCSHGAGRQLSRQAARRRISASQLERQLRGVWFDQRLSRRLCDEAPAAYKNVDSVLRAQRDLVRIVRRLRPVLNYKGI